MHGSIRNRLAKWRKRMKITDFKGTLIKFSTGIYKSKKGKIKINHEFISICFICSIAGFIYPLFCSFLEIYIREKPFNLNTTLIFSSIMGVICFLLPFIFLKDETYVK
jgi:hypothetical protein